MARGVAQGPGVCNACERYSHARDVDGLCSACAATVEVTVKRLSKSWDRDLDLMSKFEAYCHDQKDDRGPEP